MKEPANSVTKASIFYIPAPPSSSEADGQSVQALQAIHKRARQKSCFSFALHGGGINPIIDAASPLITLMLRIFDLNQHEDIDTLHKRCKEAIEAIELEMNRLNYDRVTALTFRYCICSILDEAVMCSPWGQESDWAERSLLSIFHDETWGGEKFYVILERLLMEPARYLAIIEFLYLCLCLGYEGKYHPMHNGRVQLETLIKDIHSVIRKQRGLPVPSSAMSTENILIKPYRVPRHIAAWHIVSATVVILAVMYAGFYIHTMRFTDSVVAQLNSELSGQE